MNIPKTVRSFLAGTGGKYKFRTVDRAGDLDTTAEAAGLAAGILARAVLLRSDQSAVMAIVPADRELDLERLSRMFKRDLRLASDEETRQLMPDCDPEALPPLAEPYGLRAIQDRTLGDLDVVYFASGTAGVFIRATGEDFARLQAQSWSKHLITRGAPAEHRPGPREKEALRREVEAVTELPAMPGMAAEIIRLRNNPYSHASELAAVIEQDPSLSAQLIRYATSPLYGYQGKVESVEQAIVRVLGMDFVYEFAFGLVLGKTFRNPEQGPIGLNAFWQHAVHVASLTQALCNAIDYNRRPSAGVAYLAGLLHNFGFLLLGHLFPEQFNRLNQALEEQPESPLDELEKAIVGVCHTEMGLWLMDAWDMPQELIEAVREHHNPNFRSEFSDYANLIYVANVLLKRYGVGDAATDEVPDALLERLGLDRIQAEVALSTVLEDSAGLAYIAHKMAA